MESLVFEDTYISSQSAQFIASLIILRGHANSTKLERANKQKLLDPELDLVGHLKGFFEN